MHASIPRPEYVDRREPARYTGTNIYTPDEIERIRNSGRIAAQAVEAVGAAIAPGVTTEQLDAIAHDFLIAHDAYPSTLGYRGFPKSSCTSRSRTSSRRASSRSVRNSGRSSGNCRRAWSSSPTCWSASSSSCRTRPPTLSRLRSSVAPG